MRIGIVCFSGLGGSSTVAALLARHLVKAGHTVFVLSPSLPERLNAQDGVLFRPMPPAGNPLRPGSAAEVHRLALALARVVEVDKIDTLHAHYAHPHIVAAVLARDLLPAARKPTVVATLHGTDVKANESLCGGIAAALRASDGVSAVSDSLADAAAEVFGIPRPQVIPNFIGDVSGNDCLHREHRSNSHIDRVLVHVSTLRPVKRPVDCVGILARVHQRRIPCRLLVVGEGPEASAMRSESVRLGVAKQIHFVGATPHVGAHLAHADLLLLPSASESFGMAALEAMASGVPVIGSLVKGLAEMAEDGVCARLLPVGDLDGMAAAACELLLDPFLAATYADAGRRIACDRYAPDKAIASYTEFYKQAKCCRTAPVPLGSP
jgi:N-acetyl-alpha-D-glucosaminyl L-malate synthase BshA